MWTPSVALIDYQNTEMFDKINQQIKDFSIAVSNQYDNLTKEMINKFDRSVKTNRISNRRKFKITHIRSGLK